VDSDSVLKVYEQYGLRQTFYVPGWCIERYPDLAHGIVDGGHELGLHGYLHELAYEQSPDREALLMDRSLEAADRILGARPVGWRAPFYSFSSHTAELAVRRGFTYHSGLMGDDIPYLLRTSQGDLCELPTDWAIDDWPQYVQSVDFGYFMPIRSPEHAMEVFRAEFDAAWNYGGLWIATWHPFVSGRPSRMRAVVDLIEYILAKGDVWLTTMEEIARHVLECTADGRYSPRVDEFPYYSQPIPELEWAMEKPDN
jgi:peptidoglycan-N-acetylglucosamine deacetylase